MGAAFLERVEDMALVRARFRKLWFNVHLWLGVSLFLAMIPLCLSGSYEVWHEELDRLINPQRYELSGHELRPTSAYISAANAAFSDRASAATVRLPERAGDPVVVIGPIRRVDPPAAAEGGPLSSATQRPPRRPPQLTAWIDPASARVLDVADTSKSFRQWIHRVHGSLLIPEIGRKVVGWLGWAMFISAVSGLWLWWPRGDLRKGFRWKRTPNTLLNLHYFAGFWVALPLGALALTGALISFPQTTRTALGAVAPVSPQQSRSLGGGGAPLTDPALTVDDAVAAALAATPGGVLRSVSLPNKDKEPTWRMQFERNGQDVAVSIDDRSGEAEILRPRPALAGDAALRMSRRIHDGSDMGIVWRVMITIAGVIPAILGITGVIIWASRQTRKLQMRRRAREDAAPVPAE